MVRRFFTKALSVVLAVVMVLGVVSPALAATYRPGAQSGPSSSYAGSRYYENYKRVPITGDGRTDLVAIALSQLGYQEGNANGNFAGTASGRYNYVEFSYNMGDLGLGYGGSDYPWCASFVSWCLYQSHNTDQNSYKDLGRYHVGDYKYIWKEISCSQWVRQLKGAGYYKYSKYEGGRYYLNFSDYSSTQFDDTVTVCVMEGDTVVSRTLTYSVNTYIAKNAGADTDFARLLQAVYNYGVSAKNYVA
jgi:hypothetical protein